VFGFGSRTIWSIKLKNIVIFIQLTFFTNYVCGTGTQIPGSSSTSKAVVLKREPLGSLREEFLIPGKKFVPERNWGGKAVDEKTLFFYHYFIQHIKTTVQRGWL